MPAGNLSRWLQSRYVKSGVELNGRPSGMSPFLTDAYNADSRQVALGLIQRQQFDVVWRYRAGHLSVHGPFSSGSAVS
jgi:hypothetical protein